MKRSVWKKIAASICSAVFVVAALLGVMVALPTSAQTEATWQTGVFEMQDGASLKLSEKNGLRFIVKLDETVRNFVVNNDDAQMGFVIAPKQLIDEANGDYLHMPKKVDVSVDKDKIYQEGEFFFANGCIVNVKYNSYTYDFMAVAYIKQGETVRYTEYNNYARNNLYDTVNMAVLSGYAETVLSFETYNGWYGSDVFPIVVEKTEEYNEVVSLVNEDKLDLSQKFVTVTEDVSTSREFNDEALQPNVLSQGLDVLNKQIAGLPDVENFAMPDGIGMISRIRAAEKAYNALSADDRAQVEDYAKLQGLLSAIDGYDRVYMNGENDGTVVASKVPNYTSASGGSATTRQDEVYGNVLTVQSNADGKAQLHIQNFPSVAGYAKVYFYVKTSVSCNIYLADGITNDGWGDNWHNTWGVEIGCNAGKWRLIEVSVADGYIGTNFAIGLRADTTGFTFEISDFYGIDKSKTQAVATLPFGQRTDNGTVNEYGKVYNLATQWGGDTDFQSFEANVMSNALAEGFNSFYFYIYNPNKNDVTMELVNTTSWKHYDVTTLKAGEWTKFTISAEAIEANKSGGTVCCVSSGASTAGWQMSPIYLHNSLPMAALSFGQRTDSGTENEYGKIYNLATQWGGDTDFQSFEANVLNSALTAGHDSFYFYIYNPNKNDVTMELVNTTSWKHYDVTTLKAGEWTKFTISAEAIEANKSGGTVCCVSSGASTAGWQMSPIYLGPEPEKQESVYLDHADVKAVMEQINALPQTPTESERSQVEAARAAFEALATVQQTQVTNLSKLSAAENYLTDVAAANEVIVLIDKINARDIDEALVTAARTAYNALSVTQQAYVTNASALEEYEEQIRIEKGGALAAANVNTLIANLPDSVTMPDHLVFVSRIEAARDAYAALYDEAKSMVENYAKLRSLLSMIKGYETVQVMSVDSVNVIPSTVPNYTSTVGGTASMGYDGYYGDYLKVQSNTGGKAAIQFKNFPDVSAYETLYFNIRVVGTSCDIYLADGATNDGWGDDWHNTWSMDGFWTNNGNWIQKEVAVSTGIFSADWVLGLRTNTTGFSFEITNIVGYKPELGTNTGLTFGNFTDSGTTNAYGTVYDFTQGWSSDADMGAFNPSVLKNALAEGDDAIRFYLYNPNDTAVEFKFSGDMNGWNATGEYATHLPAKTWTEVIITPTIIQQGTQGTWFVGVTTGAGTAGWKISPMYSYSTTATSGDAIDKVQTRIDALDTANPDETKVELARAAYEALNEKEKALVNAEKLIACEETLYANAALNEFIVGGETKYKLYYEEDKEAVAFVQEQIKELTDVRFALDGNEPTALTKYSYAIVFGYSSLWEELGVALPTLENDSGYAIRKVGRAVLVYATSEDGYRLAALAFLRKVIGYDMISEDCVIYNRDPATLPELNLVEAPDFEFRQQQTYMTKDELYGMGMHAHTDIWIAIEGWDMHNSLLYLPTATYRGAHPSWYYDYTDSNGTERTQICPTAGGSSAEFDLMTTEIANGMLEHINANPTLENISFSIMDTADKDDCTCTRCKLYDSLYGEGGFAAAWIDLMNAVNAKVRAKLASGREIQIAFLAYRGTEKAPVNDDFSLMKRYEIADNGAYTQTNEVLKCDEGVTVWLAPINALYAENLNHPDNAEHLATVKKWCALSSSVYVWAYGTNFKNYMYPYNSWQASAENYKILKELGVKAVWSQSNETEATAFSDLKGYIDSKFMFDVNADYNAVLNSYFTGYFGVASAKMRSMFDQIVARCETIEADYDGLGRGIYDEIENVSGFIGFGTKTYWEKSWLEGLVTLCDEAKALVDADGSLTETQKTAIKNRITKESLFPRYVLCTTFASKYSSVKKEEMRKAFKADCNALGFTLYKEANGELSNLYSAWGI